MSSPRHPLESCTPDYPARFSAPWARLALGLVLLAPVRIVLVLAINVVGGLVGELLVRVPERYSRRARRALASAGSAASLRVLGLRRLEVLGERDDRTRIVVSNHIAGLDGYVFASLGFAQLAAKDRQRWPMTLMVKLAGNVIFDRSTARGRAAAAAAIARRAVQPARPPLLIYPEGTVTNGRSLIRFKAGAFASGAPVQPLVITYRSPDCDVSWTYGCEGYLWRLLAQPYFDVRIEYLPTQSAGARSPAAFAEDVRALMAMALKVPLSDVAARVAVLMGEAERLGLPLRAGHTFHPDPTISTKQHVGLLRAFAAVNASKTGRITEQEIAAALPAGLQQETGLRPDDVVAAMGMVGAIGPPQFVEGARRLLRRDAAHRRCGLMLLDPTGTVEAVYGGRRAATA